MATLIYSVIASVDGSVEDADGGFDWAAPDLTPAARDFAGIWQGADKVVFSRSLTEPSTARTRTERDVDPDLVRRLKTTGERDLSIGGAELAGQAVRAGRVDSLQLLLVPWAAAAPTGVARPGRDESPATTRARTSSPSRSTDRPGRPSPSTRRSSRRRSAGDGRGPDHQVQPVPVVVAQARPSGGSW